jgi:hypothetical protein
MRQNTLFMTDEQTEEEWKYFCTTIRTITIHENINHNQEKSVPRLVPTPSVRIVYQKKAMLYSSPLLPR